MEDELNNSQEEIQEAKLPSNLRELEIWKSQFFKQSNYLAEAVFEQPFKEFELKILALISMHISKSNSLPFDEKEKLIKITLQKEEFCKSLNIDPQHFYHMAKTIAPDFHKKSVLIEIFRQPDKTNRTKKEFHSMSLIPLISCKDNQIIFYISPVLQPYLQKLRVQYTLLSLEYISRMGSSHAIKIYQLLAQYQNMKKRTFSVSELKKVLGIPNKYKDFQRFKEEVIEVSIKHINQHSNLGISFNIEKVGKRAENINFKIRVRETQFQQAVRKFTEEIDKILEKDIMGYQADHQKLRECWKNSKKNIEKNQKLFDEWILQKTENYQSESLEKLHFIENTDWYRNFHKKGHEEIMKQYNFSKKKKI